MWEGNISHSFIRPFNIYWALTLAIAVKKTVSLPWRSTHFQYRNGNWPQTTDIINRESMGCIRMSLGAIAFGRWTGSKSSTKEPGTSTGSKTVIRTENRAQNWSSQGTPEPPIWPHWFLPKSASAGLSGSELKGKHQKSVPRSPVNPLSYSHRPQEEEDVSLPPSLPCPPFSFPLQGLGQASLDKSGLSLT